MKKVLITGASGFIGRNSIPILLKSGYEVHAVSKTIHTSQDTNLFWHSVDLLNHQSIIDLFEQIHPSHLLHFAWYTEHSKYWTSWENVRWLEASIRILDNFLKFGGKRVVVAGTCAEYDWSYGYCSEFLTPLLPSSLYGTSKYALYLLMNEIAKQHKLSLAWGRIFFTFGPHEHPDRFIPSIIRSLLHKKSVKCLNCDKIRDYLFVKDVADAFVSLLTSGVEGPVNIGSGKPITLKNLVDVIAQKMNREELIDILPALKNDEEPYLIVANINKLTKDVGWTPRFTLYEGLDSTINWWKKNP